MAASVKGTTRTTSLNIATTALAQPNANHVSACRLGEPACGITHHRHTASGSNNRASACVRSKWDACM